MPGKIIFPLHKGRADRTRVSKKYQVFFFCSFTFNSVYSYNSEHFRDQKENSAGTWQMFKRFYEPENWMMAHTVQSCNDTTEFVNDSVGDGQTQPQYIGRMASLMLLTSKMLSSLAFGCESRNQGWER